MFNRLCRASRTVLERTGCSTLDASHLLLIGQTAFRSKRDSRRNSPFNNHRRRGAKIPSDRRHSRREHQGLPIEPVEVCSRSLSTASGITAARAGAISASRVTDTRGYSREPHPARRTDGRCRNLAGLPAGNRSVQPRRDTTLMARLFRPYMGRSTGFRSTPMTRGFHSARKAIIGSTLIARQAGIHAPMSARPTRTDGTPTKTAMS